MRPAGLYRIKPEAQRLMRPLVGFLVARGVSADALTIAAVPAALLGGIALAVSDEAPVLLLTVPFLAAIRLILNLLDGQVARQSGTTHPFGEVLNELGDRVADTVFIGGLAFVAVVGPGLALAAVIASLLASYAGITASAVGASRQYGGVMSKPGRMIVLGVAAPLTFVLGEGTPLFVAVWVILVGALTTLVQRLVTTRRLVEGDAP